MDPQAVDAVSPTATAAAPLRPQRLSQWLLERGARAEDYLPGTLWRVDDEVPRQQALRLELRADLTQLAMPPAASARSRTPSAGDSIAASEQQRRAAATRLLRWMDQLPVTGRVPLRSADARWLEVNPAHDPMLGEGSRATVPARPATVTVITPEGLRCQVLHRPMAEALAYVEACSGREAAARVDHAWVVQPDGRIMRHGVAPWNEQAQLPPAPGAWIWAPPRDQRWPDATSARIAARLATQGLAADTAADGARAAAAASPAGASPAAASTADVIEAASPQPVPRPPARDLPITASDWGVVGLLQTPSARMQPTGFFGFTASRTTPYTHGTVSLQPLQWLEVAFRYSSLGNVLYGPAIAGDQSYKDKSIDVKALLWDETTFLPALAVGFRDLTGTGLFSGEYLVASKRTGAFDWSLGLGWGYLGARGNLPNPLGSDNRPQADTGQGGNFSFGTYFRGRTSLFGGVQWQTPWSPLVLKLEYDGNDYQREPFGARFEQRSPFNLGAVYRVGPNLDLTLGYERGDRIMLGFSINTQLDGLRMPKTADAPRVPVARERPQVPVPVALAASPQAPMAGPSTAQSVVPPAAQSADTSAAQSADTSAARAPIDWEPSREALRVQTQWHAARFELRGRELRVTFDDAEAGYWHDRVDRAASVLHRDAPADVDRFVLAYRQRGSVMAEHVVDRDAWVRERFKLLPPREQRPSVMARPPAVAAPAPQCASQASAPAPQCASQASAPADVAPPRFEHGLSLALRTSFGGPDAFLLYQVSAVEQFRWRLRADTWVQGTVALGLIDNYDRFRYTAPSDLPRVRTYAREYVTSTALTLPNLQITHVGNPSRDHFYSVYGGYLESMFAGLGGEWLYRPFGSRVALGVDANLVRQRSFEQDFGFGNAGTQTGYQVATGHATLYWDTGWNDVRAQVAAGRYLAGDVGATFQLSRGFDNGVTVGAFFTKTNVSAERFGEGSFDKGIFVRVPFDAFLMRSSARAGTFLYQPLTRDGGARLGRVVQLIQHTTLRDEHGLRIRAPGAPDPLTGLATEGRVDASRDPAEQADRWLRRQGEDEARTRVVPRAFFAADRARATDAHALPPASVDSFEALDAQLYAQGFRDLRIAMDTSRTLSVSVTRDRIESPSRAVGRVARTAAAYAPLDTRGVKVTLTRRGAPVVTYDFFDFAQLQAVMAARERPQALEGRVGIAWHDAGAREADALSGLAVLDRPTQPEPGPTLTQVLLPEAGQVARVRDDFLLAGSAVQSIDWLRAGTVFGATVLGASLLDERVDRAAYRHREADWMRAGIRVGDALPWAALAGSALLAFDPSDADRARTARSATEAGASGMVLAWALKPMSGRMRPGPTSGASHRDFEPFSVGGGRDSFPSTHTTVAWAVLTPWALEYNAPWLYGVAGLTNLARAGSREHWLSDTVAGSVLGYGLGYLFWQSGRTPARPGEARVSVGPQQVKVGWTW